jgi:hypothetical protein
MVAAMLAAATLAGCPPRGEDELHTQTLSSASTVNEKQLYFIPNDTAKRAGDPFYSRVVTDLPVPGQLPNSTAADEVLEFPEGGGSVDVELDEPVMYYGVFYDTIVVGSNGTVGFGQAGAGNDTLEHHFLSPQISLLPVNATLGETEVTVAQTEDFVVVTFDNVVIGTDTEFTSDNSFQLELFKTRGIDGDLAISYAKVDSFASGIVGLSNGQLAGLDQNDVNQFLRRFRESNLAANANTGTR